jgi:hypothetical protein
LVFPLSRHGFSISATDCNTSIQAGLVMGLHDLHRKERRNEERSLGK